MPYIIVKMTSSNQAIKLNFGANKASRVRIHSYEAEGLTSSAPLFLEIRNVPTTLVVGNGFASQFPLGMGQIVGTTAFVQLNKPIIVTEGDNMWNDTHEVVFRIQDFNGNPATFTRIYIFFEYDAVDPRISETGRLDANEVQRIPVTEMVGRNVDPLPWQYRNPHIDSDQSTSYPYRM